MNICRARWIARHSGQWRTPWRKPQATTNSHQYVIFAFLHISIWVISSRMNDDRPNPFASSQVETPPHTLSAELVEVPNGPAPSAWNHAPHDEPDPDDAREVFKSELPPDLQFTPVPRQRNRSDGFTPERQRTFIAMLAATGCVRTAARAIGCAHNHSLYKLRNAAGAESFAAAWDNAVRRGARRILDVMVDNAINGTPEYLYVKGQMAAERRRFNTRAQMWLVAHYLPDQFGVSGGLMNTSGSADYMARIKKIWRAEWAREDWERKQANKVDVEALKAEIIRKVNLADRPRRQEIANSPEKRAAYELLHGPQDWEKFLLG